MSKKTLFIIESGGKVKKLNELLGKEFIVKPTMGHIMDLPKDSLGIDVTNNFEANYITNPDKKQLVKELKKCAEECDDIMLCSDMDREGEMISQNVKDILKLKKYKRVVFNEITKKAIEEAIKNPRLIDDNMVNSQKCRRYLDRLIGFYISPILWKYLPGIGTSTGRIQGVALRIIVDKENEINKSISEPFFKTTAELNLCKKSDDDIVKLNATLVEINKNKMYNFTDFEKAQEFLSLINKKTEFKVVSVDNRKSIRKASEPFITSTLQQEASSKLHFSVKRTAEISQKLYEKGHITYIRTDSPNISDSAIEEAKKYIIKNWSAEYSEPKQYKSKNSNAQEAHECIRPTHLEIDSIESPSPEEQRLYALIWKRTIASQMSNAQVNIQTIKIDALNNKESILLFTKEQTLFNSTLENIEFPGYLTVYDNTDNNSENDDKINGKIEIKVKDKLSLNKMKISEEYTKPPLRYNEALLIKFLEKKGIGRPSTYSSIISKIIEREYVKIDNVEGIKKESKQLELDNKYKLKESVKEVFIGKEQKKIVATEVGKKVNEFMMTHFSKILDIDFTATLETHLDKIALGEANWITVLRNFYELFNPMVEKLNKEAKDKVKELGSATDKLLGENDNKLLVYSGTGKYGPYVKMELEDKKGWKYSSLKETEFTPETIELEDAIILLEYPKDIGKIGNAHVTLNKGKFGLYFKCNGKNISIPDKDVDISIIDIEYSRKIIEAFNNGSTGALKTFNVKDKVINVRNGEFGNYVQIISANNKKENISIPKKYNIENISIDDIMQIISDKRDNPTKEFSKKKYYNKK
jgi:DNA topoisomerase-1